MKDQLTRLKKLVSRSFRWTPVGRFSHVFGVVLLCLKTSASVSTTARSVASRPDVTRTLHLQSSIEDRRRHGRNDRNSLLWTADRCEHQIMLHKPTG